jgi:hypothetical protein
MKRSYTPKKQKKLINDYPDSIPTPEEWEWITSDEPELTYLKDQIRKNGKINEEI